MASQSTSYDSCLIQQSDGDTEAARQYFAKEGAVQLEEFRDINYILVAAIDFGSTYSGYAFSTRLSFKAKPLEISSACWQAGNAQSHKTATCVLFKPNKSFHSFGYMAESEYARLVEGNVEGQNHQDWYFFRRFKMQLYKAKEIKWNMQLSAVDGKTLPALKVFTACIQYLKEQMLEQCKKQNFIIEKPDIRWVVTVPAIWNDDAKQFMRKAAEMADIPGPQLFLALEAEAAALYCKNLPVQSLVVRPEDSIHVFSPTETYMILDIGGGTVDVTVHEVQNDLTLKEVHMATGGNWGGLTVDDAFENLLLEIVGRKVYEKFKTEHPSDLLELLRSFEIKKRTIKFNNGKTTFTIPISLSTTFEEMCPGITISDIISKNPKLEHNVEWKFDKLKLSNRLATSLFNHSFKHIREHLQELLTLPEVDEISAIIMVGGFSECSLLHSMVEETFPNVRVIVPNEASLAVLKGAVINGHAPDTVKERICRYTYDVASSMPFINTKHREDYAFYAEGRTWCDNIFSRHLTKYETVPLFVPGLVKPYDVVYRDQEILKIEVYISTEKDPFYVTDPSCSEIGSLSIDMSDISRGLDRGVQVTMTLGGAELQVKAVDKHTKEKRFVYFDFIGTPSEQEVQTFLE